MNDVAEEAGVTKPVLYQHFASKRELYLELLADVGQRLLHAIQKATSEAGGPREQVEYGFRAYFRWVHDHHHEFTLLFGSGARRDEEFAVEVRRVEEAVAEAIATLIQADVSREHRELLAYGLVGLSEGTSRRLIARGGDFDPDVLAAQVADLAWGGLRSIRRIDG